jgi:FkbM family methyltransferase
MDQDIIEVNLFGGFTHLDRDNGHFSMTDNRTPKYWRWVRNKMNHDGVTIFTDDKMCDTELVKSVNSKYKVGMIIEPHQINSNVYNNIDSIVNNFDFIITYNKDLIEKYPNKIKYYPYGGSWVLEDNIGVYEKSKNINIIYSNKFITDGHKLRHEIANKFPNIDRFGLGTGVEFNFKEEILAPYRFSIIVENSKIDDYFSEKILDAFAVGTIPVYYGTDNIGEYFDKEGIIIFNTLDELEKLLPTLTEELYNSKLEAVIKNNQLVEKYYCQEDWLYYNIFNLLDLPQHYEMVDYSPSDPRTEVEGYKQDHWLNKFFSEGGDDQFLYNFPLTPESIVFDLGSYDGDYCNRIFSKYLCNIHSFEPVYDFYQKHKNNHKGTIINNFALGAKNEEFTISVNDNSSSQFIEGEKITCKKIKFLDYIQLYNINKINLIKINIEGGEYEILNEIIKCGFTQNIDIFLIQFHYLSNNPIIEREQIVKELLKTHKPLFSFPFVWECYIKK